MHARAPSATAFAAAYHRAVHQLMEAGSHFRDPLALRILDAEHGPRRDELLREAESHPERRPMRMFIAVRSRFAEQCLAHAVDAGVSQLVVLGAGLDTFAYRNPFQERLEVFEVDHPATQAWKRDRLTQTGIAVPGSTRYVAVDFERDALEERLLVAGFMPTRPSFFTWLGVVPYLTEPAVFETLSFISGLPGGSHVVFDYANPPELLEAAARARHAERSARVAALGEAFLSHFDSERLAERLSALGYAQIDDLGPAEIRARVQVAPSTPAREHGGHIVYAATTRN